jgi:hypothetical protein
MYPSSTASLSNPVSVAIVVRAFRAFVPPRRSFSANSLMFCRGQLVESLGAERGQDAQPQIGLCGDVW